MALEEPREGGGLLEAEGVADLGDRQLGARQLLPRAVQAQQARDGGDAGARSHQAALEGALTQPQLPGELPGPHRVGQAADDQGRDGVDEVGATADDRLVFPAVQGRLEVLQEEGERLRVRADRRPGGVSARESERGMRGVELRRNTEEAGVGRRIVGAWHRELDRQRHDRLVGCPAEAAEQRGPAPHGEHAVAPAGGRGDGPDELDPKPRPLDAQRRAPAPQGRERHVPVEHRRQIGGRLRDEVRDLEVFGHDPLRGVQGEFGQGPGGRGALPDRVPGLGRQGGPRGPQPLRTPCLPQGDPLGFGRTRHRQHVQGPPQRGDGRFRHVCFPPIRARDLQPDVRQHATAFADRAF